MPSSDLSNSWWKAGSPASASNWSSDLPKFPHASCNMRKTRFSDHRLSTGGSIYQHHAGSPIPHHQSPPPAIAGPGGDFQTVFGVDPSTQGHFADPQAPPPGDGMSRTAPGRLGKRYPLSRKNPAPLNFQNHETLASPSSQWTCRWAASYGPGRRDSEYMRLMLDRAATAIAQELLRRMSIEERRMRKMQKWIEEWLQQGKAEFPEELVSIIREEGVWPWQRWGTRHTQPPLTNPMTPRKMR